MPKNNKEIYGNDNSEIQEQTVLDANNRLISSP